MDQHIYEHCYTLGILFPVSDRHNGRADCGTMHGANVRWQVLSFPKWLSYSVAMSCQTLYI
eukprot:7724234-Heterocapsa_arctica.AAC.1